MKHNLFFRTISKFSYVLVIFTLLFSGLSISPAKAAPAGTALQFNGSSQYATFGAAPSLGAATFTLETWFKRTGAGVGTSTGSGGITAVPLVTKGRAEAEGSNVDMNYFLGIDATSGKLAADFEEGSSTGGTLGLNHPVSGNTAITSNVWHHAAATYDGQTWNLYLDGMLDGTLTLSVARPPRSDSIQHAGIGTAMNSTGVAAGFFQGTLDEARIWSVARTQAQIQAARYQELTSGSGLLGRWGMNEGTGTVVGNSVGGGVSGTAVNGPTWVAGFPDAIPPASPSGLSAAGRSNSVRLNWTANSESDLASYRVYRGTSSPVATGGAPLASVAAPATTYLDTTSANGTTYYYALTAVDTSGNPSAASNEASATPQPGSYGLDLGSGTAYVTFGDPAKLDLSNWTIETWFKRTGGGTPNTTGGGGVAAAIPLVTHGAPQAEGSNVDANWILAIDDTTDVLAADFEDMTSGANHPVRGATVITDNVWHHAAATYDGTTWRLYLDGRLDATLVVNAAPRSDSIQRAGLGTMLTSTGTALGHFQ